MQFNANRKRRSCGDAFFPSIVTPEQRTAFQEWLEAADRWSARTGLSRRDFLRSQMGLAAFFFSMNGVFGPFFAVDPSEAAEMGAAEEKNRNLADQFVFDVQVHFVHDDYPSPEGLLMIREEAKKWDPGIEGEQLPEDLKYERFIEEVFKLSETKAAVLSNAPADEKEGWFLSNEEAIRTRERVNGRLGNRRRLLAHGVFTPGQPGWMDDLERVIALKPDAWKGYTLGDPMGESKYPWRLDDEKRVYPAFEKMEKAGIRNVCIHKGLLLPDYRQKLTREQIAYAKVDDIPKAAKDWPNLNFIIYHSAIEKVFPAAEDAAEFRKTGKIDWVTALSEIPEKHGVKNVYAELGAVFGTTCISHPELAAGVLGTLIRGFGEDRLCWGTDSIWLGSPQWQIDAMRRIEIPENMQKNFGFRPLGPADGPVKRAILGENSARLYNLSVR